MAAAKYATRIQHFKLVQCVKGDPKDTVSDSYHEPLKNTSHTVLKVREPGSPGPEEFYVNILNGSNGKKFPVKVSGTDTIEILKQKVLIILKLKEILNLVFNGKQVLPQQTLCELKVNPEDTFITYDYCEGG